MLTPVSHVLALVLHARLYNELDSEPQHSAGVHCLRARGGDSDVLLDDHVADVLLFPRGGAAAEAVAALLLDALVGAHVVAQHLGVRGGDDARVDVRARAEVVEDTRGDRGGDEGEGVCALLGGGGAGQRGEEGADGERGRTSMLGRQPASNMAMAARLPEPMVT